MSAKNYMRLLIASFLVGIGISLMSCGSSGGGNATATSADGTGTTSSSTTSAVGTSSVGCSSGYFSVDGVTCTAASTFEQACSFAGGIIFQPGTLLANSAEVCRTSRAQYVSMAYSYVPVLSPSIPAGLMAASDPAFSLLPGDRVIIENVQGGYGGIQQTSCFFGLSTCQQTNCSATSASGSLYVSDSVTATAASAGASFVATQASPPLFGFNVSGQSTVGCSSAAVSFMVVRCLDASGATHTCQ